MFQEILTYITKTIRKHKKEEKYILSLLHPIYFLNGCKIPHSKIIKDVKRIVLYPSTKFKAITKELMKELLYIQFNGSRC